MTTYEKNIFNDSFCYIQTIEKIQINTKLSSLFHTVRKSQIVSKIPFSEKFQILNLNF